MNTSMRKHVIALTTALAVVGFEDTQARATTFQDVLVQSPNITQPQRGSLAGTLSRVTFGAGDLARGAFKLPLPIEIPSERGPLLAGVVPSYSAEAGISEWGMGWQADLAIRRFRPIGELDFSTDDFTSPWGRLIMGEDGYYPTGLANVVRVTPSVAGWLARTADGTRFMFAAADAVTTSRGTFMWMLSRVDNIGGDATTLQWSRNASGRPFLSAVQWGGRQDGTQYRMTFDYEAIPTAFVSYLSGDKEALDQRVAGVTVSVKQGGEYVMRWHYTLGYQASATGPGFYLHSVVKTYASGESEPPVVYDYDLGNELRASAQFASIPGLDSFLRANGGLALQPDQAAVTDLEQDGLIDLETALDQTTIHQTEAGFVTESLPPAMDANPACRPPTSFFNRPRTLARMHEDAIEPQVVWIENNPDGTRSHMLVCDRLGSPIYDQSVAGSWELNENTRLVDLDLDRRPDIVRVSFGEADVLLNTSASPQTVSFAPGPVTALSPQFTPLASWVLDFNGDGRADLMARHDSGVVVWLGSGGGQFEPTGTNYEFVTANGPLADFSSYQFSHGDFNGDGLSDVILTQGQNAHLFTNRGSSFAEIPVPALENIPWLFSYPLVADLSGSGNEQAVFVSDTQAMAIQLTSPSTGLLRSADDGKGTVMRFGYGRVRPTPGINHRHAVLAKLSVESSGYDTVSYSYDYGRPVLHTTGKYLVGFASVEKHSPLLTERVEFLNDDDISGVRSLSDDVDDRTPGIVRFTSQRYDDVRFRGVRWLRPSVVETGYRNADGMVKLSAITQYSLYERDLCPTVITTTLPAGQLISTTTLASVPTMPDELHCLTMGRSLVGSHPDTALDFNYLASFERNDIGQVTRVTQFDGAMHPLVLQEVGYDADHRVASIAAPGRGTTTMSYDAVGRLVGIIDPTGVVTRVTEFDSLTDALHQLETTRPEAPSRAFFRYDGRERLQAAWDDFSGASEAQPLASYIYQDATNTTPARIDTQSLADAITGSTRNTVALLGADGEPMVGGTWLGDHVALGLSSITDRSTLTKHRSFLGTINAAALSTLTSSDLRTAGTELDETVLAGFGHAIQTVTTQQANVVGVTTSELVLGATELVSRVHQPGGFTAESAVDAAGKLVRKTDENSVSYHYSYDALGRLVHVSAPDGTQTLTFDGFGRPARVSRDGIGAITYGYDPVTGLAVHKQHLDATGAVVDTSDVQYDALGRTLQVSQTSDTGASSVAFAYDGKLDGATAAGQLGRLTRVRGDGWERSELFDPLGRSYEQHVTLSGWRDVTIEKSYRPDGSVASATRTIRDSSGAIRFSSIQETDLDSLGRTKNVKLDGAVLYTLSYDDEGRLARADFASGEAITFDHDAVTHERRGHVVQAPGVTGGVDWERDQRGLVAAETYTNGTATTRRAYSYDGRGALTSATSGADTDSYSYTASGLPDTVRDMLGSRSVHHTSDTLTVGDVAYRWDAAGRVSGKGEWTFTYGGSGQLTHASRPGRQVDFVYDESDQRILKRVDGIPVRADVVGGVLTEDHFIELVTVGGVVAGVLDNGRFTALLTDPRGTPFAGPDGTPGLATPYGVRASHLGYAEVIDYARLGWDADLDLVRMGVRDYEPRLAQFLTPDPLYFENLEKCQASPLQCSLYGYAGGNPVSFVDPTGLGVVSWIRNVVADTIELSATVAGGIVGGGVAGVAGAPTGPADIAIAAGGAVLGAGLARGIASPFADLIRGEEPSVSRELSAVRDGMTVEMGGQVVGKIAGPYIQRSLAGTSKSADGSGAVKWTPRTLTPEELCRVSAAAERPGAPPLPRLDHTGKVHGALPGAAELKNYSLDELSILREELTKSVPQRIQSTIQHGSDPGHSARQAAEQQLIRQIDKLLSGS